MEKPTRCNRGQGPLGHKGNRWATLRIHLAPLTCHGKQETQIAFRKKGDSLVTIKDVAREANVSASTVSRVLSKSANVSKEKRERVLAAMKKLGYVPNLAAQSLRGNGSFVNSWTKGIGVIVSSKAMEISPEFFTPILEGIQIEAEQQNQVVAFNRRIDEFANKPSLLNELAPEVATGLVFVGCSPYNDQVLSQVVDGEVPIVLVEFTYKGLDAVIADKWDGMRQAVNHLASFGHRQIVYVGPVDERARGFEMALQEAELCRSGDIIFPAEFSLREGYRACREVLGRRSFTGLVAASDAIAFGAIRAIHDAGLSVPEDVSVLGFDDVPMAEFLTPRLTTVAVNKVDMGRYAVRRLMDSATFAGLELSGTVTICPVGLVVRESTGPAKS